MVIRGLQSDHTLIKNGQMAKKIAVFVTDFTLSGMIKCNAQTLFQKKIGLIRQETSGCFAKILVLFAK